LDVAHFGMIIVGCDDLFFLTDDWMPQILNDVD